MDYMKLSSVCSLRGDSFIAASPWPWKPSSYMRTSRLPVTVKAQQKNSVTALPSQQPPFPLQEKSRGELFLQQALSKRLSDEQRSKKSAEKKTKKKDVLKHRSEPSCYGCGTELQTQDEEAPGFVPLSTYETKKKHKQLKTVLCGRCHSLSHGRMIPAVGGHGGYSGGKRFVSAEKLRMELSSLCQEKALITYLVDIVDFNGSFLTRIRDVVGANPVVLVVTKVDLLPVGTDFNAIADWIVEFLTRKKLNVIAVHLTSSKSLVGISSVVSYIRLQRQGRNVYILGSANVGKSAFVTAFLQELSKRDFSASSALRRLPVQSAMPGTTLGPIEINAFSGGGSLFDTPGIHVHHRMTAAVPPEDLTLLAPRNRLKGYLVAPSIFRTVAQIDSEDDLASNEDCRADKPSLRGAKVRSISLSGTSVLWGGIARLDIIKAPPYVGFRFFGPNRIPKEIVATSEADAVYKELLGRKLSPPTNAEGWAGLERQHALSLTFESWKRPASDIAISGLGWITIESGYDDLVESSAGVNMGDVDNVVEVVVHVPKPVEVYVRPPLPIGFRGSDWYDYKELSDKELEERPKVFLP